jgi:hypothetical protein
MWFGWAIALWPMMSAARVNLRLPQAPRFGTMLLLLSAVLVMQARSDSPFLYFQF